MLLSWPWLSKLCYLGPPSRQAVLLYERDVFYKKYNYLEETKSEAISAYLNWRYWKSESFLLNCFLEFIYFLAAYKQKAAPPKLQLAMLILPPSRAFMAILNPDPSVPIKF